MRLFLFFAAWLFPVFCASAQDLSVTVSTAPLHSVVSAVMKGAGSPVLLLPATVSPHDYRLKPSDMRKLAQADIVFWNAQELEGFLPKALEAAGASGKSVEIMKSEGMVLIPARSLHKGESGEYIDPHYWLEPENMAAAARAVAGALADKDPARAGLYRGNAADFARRAKALSLEIKEKFKGMKGGNFLFFHDAFAYFEKAAGITSLGAVEAGHGAEAGARRLAELRAKIESAGPVCLFSEPQFPDKRAAVLSEGLSVRMAKADPMGAGLETGENFYSDLMRNLIKSLYECLRTLQE